MRKKPDAVPVIGGHQWTIVFDHFGIDVSTSFSQYSEKAFFSECLTSILKLRVYY